ncbi:hypothetical protein, partial [Cardiobacterium hominis]|uniref:hypothetical protein n=1 Tax=Cardiobacterium hominis TaxID=2718 RepID=UPI002492E4FB
AHEKSPKCLGGNLGDFGGILQRSLPVAGLETKPESHRKKPVIFDGFSSRRVSPPPPRLDGEASSGIPEKV